jgi:3'-phosphoadenosine 5'-phosphosulfate sulfotransferase (PAPS reductase)/FAD synthetase
MVTDLSYLHIRQKYPLELKIELSRLRIRQWYRYHHGNVYIAFSGGKDSTVLVDLVRSEFPDVVAVFSNTFNEFPEILKFVRTMSNVTWITPAMTVEGAIKKYGYPVVSKENSQKISEARTTKSAKLLHKRLHGDDNPYKSGKIPDKWQYLINAPFLISHKCCDVLKRKPFRKYEKKTGFSPILGVMANDSHARKQKGVVKSCNSFDSKRPESNPMMFWNTDDVWEYIKQKELPYSSIYDMGYKNTGCVACCFGVHLEPSDEFSENKFQLMERTHPSLYRNCIDRLGMGRVLDFIKVNYRPSLQKTFNFLDKS